MALRLFTFYELIDFLGLHGEFIWVRNQVISRMVNDGRISHVGPEVTWPLGHHIYARYTTSPGAAAAAQGIAEEVKSQWVAAVLLAQPD